MMRTVYQGVVHPWLCDAMGHLTTRHYMGMFDDASYHLWRHLFGYAGPTGAFAGKGWADVKHVIEYKGEVAAGTLVEVRGELVKLGGKSVTVRFELVNLATGEVAATMEAVTAFFDLQARKAIPLTDAMRHAAGAQPLAGTPAR
jgi:acyl-CoA thioester hydrolase